MTRPPPTVRTRLIAPAAVVAVALVAGACGGAVAVRPTGTTAPRVGPEAGVTSHYGADTSVGDRATSLAAQAATRSYATQVGVWTSDFVASVDTLQTDVAEGDTPAAESDEVAAQADFDAFRVLETDNYNSINASTLDELETDVVPGETFGGLHAVERDLWAGGPAATDVAGLAAQAPVAQFLLSRMRLGPEAVGSEAVGELNWVVDTALTRSQEPVSHLGLVDVDATEAAAAQAFGDIEPLARLVDPTLTATVAAQFTTLDGAVAALGPPDTTPDTTVAPAGRLAVSQQLDATATTLARLVARLTPYGTQGSPS